MDECIIRYLQKKHQVAIGISASEKLKIECTSALAGDSRPEILNVVGKDLLTGIPRTMKISREEIRESIEEPISAIIDAVRRALEKLPPEFVSDLNETGMILTGGGALLRGLDKRIEDETDIKVYVTDDPLFFVVLGAGQALEDMVRYKKVFIS